MFDREKAERKEREKEGKKWGKRTGKTCGKEKDKEKTKFEEGKKRHGYQFLLEARGINSLDRYTHGVVEDPRLRLHLHPVLRHLRLWLLGKALGSGSQLHSGVGVEGTQPFDQRGHLGKQRMEGGEE